MKFLPSSRVGIFENKLIEALLEEDANSLTKMSEKIKIKRFNVNEMLCERSETIHTWMVSRG